LPVVLELIPYLSANGIILLLTVAAFKQAVRVGVSYWWFLWEVAGAFLAVPFFATLKIFADHAESLTPIAIFLEE
jgi:hypothetical protein